MMAKCWILWTSPSGRYGFSSLAQALNQIAEILLLAAQFKTRLLRCLLLLLNLIQPVLADVLYTLKIDSLRRQISQAGQIAAQHLQHGLVTAQAGVVIFIRGINTPFQPPDVAPNVRQFSLDKPVADHIMLAIHSISIRYIVNFITKCFRCILPTRAGYVRGKTAVRPAGGEVWAA